MKPFKRRERVFVRETDPKHILVHRVTDPEMWTYTAGERDYVVAVCGKKWAPQEVNQRFLYDQETCSVCFPPRREYLAAR